MTQQCNLVELQPQITLIVHTRSSVGDLPRVLGEAYGAIMQHLNSLGEVPHGAPYVAYYNMDMENLELDAGIPVGKTLPAGEPVQLSEIPGGTYATTIFKGPYQELTTPRMLRSPHGCRKMNMR